MYTYGWFMCCTAEADRTLWSNYTPIKKHIYTYLYRHMKAYTQTDTDMDTHTCAYTHSTHIWTHTQSTWTELQSHWPGQNPDLGCWELHALESCRPQAPCPAHLGDELFLGTQLVNVAQEIRVCIGPVLFLLQLILILSTFCLWLARGWVDGPHQHLHDVHILCNITFQANFKSWTCM